MEGCVISIPLPVFDDSVSVGKPSWLVPPFGGWHLCARAASYYCTNVIVLTDPPHDSMSGKGGC